MDGGRLSGARHDSGAAFPRMHTAAHRRVPSDVPAVFVARTCGRAQAFSSRAHPRAHRRGRREPRAKCVYGKMLIRKTRWVIFNRIRINHRRGQEPRPGPGARRRRRGRGVLQHRGPFSSASKGGGHGMRRGVALLRSLADGLPTRMRRALAGPAAEAAVPAAMRARAAQCEQAPTLRQTKSRLRYYAKQTLRYVAVLRKVAVRCGTTQRTATYGRCGTLRYYAKQTLRYHPQRSPAAGPGGAELAAAGMRAPAQVSRRCFVFAVETHEQFLQSRRMSQRVSKAAARPEQHSRCRARNKPKPAASGSTRRSQRPSWPMRTRTAWSPPRLGRTITMLRVVDTQQHTPVEHLEGCHQAR